MRASAGRLALKLLKGLKVKGLMKNIVLTDAELRIITDKLNDGDSHSVLYFDLLKRLLAAQGE